MFKLSALASPFDAANFRRLWGRGLAAMRGGFKRLRASDPDIIAWPLRCVVVCLGFGALFAGLDALALHWLEIGSMEIEPLNPGSVLSGIGVTAAGYGALGLVVGLLTLPVVGAPRARWLAAGGLALVLSSALLANLVSAVLCLYSGSYLTVGALQFTLNSFAHVSGAALSGHGPSLIGILAFSLFLCGLLTLLLGRTHRFRGHRKLRLAYAFMSVPPALALFTFEGYEDQRYQHAVWKTTPELAFYSSLERSLTPGPDLPQAEFEAAPAPSLSTARLWEGTAKISDRAPNVLLVILESVSIKFLGYLGSDAGVTPNLDKLAHNSLQLRRAWTTATHSNYAQMAILSSLVPRRGMGLDTYQRLDYPRFLYRDALHHLGYRTATISSQDESWQGMSRFEDTGTPTHFRDARAYHGPRVDIGSERIVPDHETAQSALKWIEAQPGRWSAYVNFQATHFPYRLAAGVSEPFQPTEIEPGTFNYLRYPEAAEPAAINRYKNALRYVDAQLGKLVKKLESLGELDNTLIVVTSDHGEMFHDHGLVTHGRTLFEQESRVPLLFHWPQGLKPEVSNQPVSTLDVLPTILSLLGAPLHPAHQGEPIMKAGKVRAQSPAILMNIQGLRSMEGIVCWPYKLTRNVGSGQLRLFDLERDPGEQEDLSLTEGKRTRELGTLLVNMMNVQDRYHKKGDLRRTTHFAPRVPDCPF